MLMKVGELARRSGITVRTLHHYGHIGLLTPSDQSAAGHRLYTAEDAERLQRIVSLKSLGFSLEEIGDMLGGGEYPAERVLKMHAERLRARIEEDTRLLENLTYILNRLGNRETVTADEFIQITREIVMFEKHYTPEQMETIKRRAAEVGQERIEASQREWMDLIAKVREAMDRGLSPGDEPVLGYARKWRSLVDEFTGGDKGIEASLARMYREEPAALEMSGNSMDPAMFDYIGKAMAALGGGGGASAEGRA